MKNKKALIEAALFMSSDPLPLKRLVKATNLSENEIIELVNEIKQAYKDENHGIHIIETKEGYNLKVKPDYISAVRHLTPYHDISRGLLKVLALVAYKQPITQSQIVKVIGNRTYEYVKKLVEKGLIRTVKAGRTKALIATKGFLDYFGLESIEDAKKLFEDINLEEPEKDDISEAEKNIISSEHKPEEKVNNNISAEDQMQREHTEASASADDLKLSKKVLGPGKSPKDFSHELRNEQKDDNISETHILEESNEHIEENKEEEE